MRVLRKIGCLVCGLLFIINSIAQNDTSKPLKIAVFAPVYLDSAFTGDNYKLGKNFLPRFILPGLDFYNGVTLAIDSLNAEGVSVEVLFYDTKSVSTSINQAVTTPEIQDASLIIASFNNRTEIKPLADFALQKNIPLISATYPNDGGITANPFFVMINPKLSTHLDAIYRYLQRMYPTEKITVFRKKGNMEDMIQHTFSELNMRTQGIPLKFKTVELTDSFTTSQVISYLDSTKQNIVVCGTLHETFGTNLSKALSSSKTYRVTAIGMPTWDGLKDISKDLDIVYSTPYNLTRSDKQSKLFIDDYRAKYAGWPGDMAFKGFEAMYHFTKLLLKYDKQLINHLSDREYKLFNEFDFQPYRANKASTLPDYLENKKLYFIRKVDGKIRSVN